MLKLLKIPPPIKKDCLFFLSLTNPFKSIHNAQVGDKRQHTNLTFSAGDPCRDTDCNRDWRRRQRSCCDGRTAFARAGYDNHGVNGGPGYSGGSGDGNYYEKELIKPKCSPDRCPRNLNAAPGGSDGKRGPRIAYHGNSGRGSGEDITSYTFNTWTLTPGAGGTPYNRFDSLGPRCQYSQCFKNPNQFYGGGGGGVLVNGAGPKATKHQGQGYGGGGSGANRVNTAPGYSFRYGYPGVDVGGLPGVILLEIETY